MEDIKKSKIVMCSGGYLMPSYDELGKYNLSDNMIYILCDSKEKYKTSLGINHLLNQANNQIENNRIVVKNGHHLRIIPVEEIIYIEAYDDYVKIHVTDATLLKKQTLGFYEKAYEKNNFLRVHRSYLIQLNQITKVEPFEKNGHIAILKNNSKIPLSRSGYVKLKEVLGL
jgi:DNA-binding LytR/AlgR family response regulator